MSERRKQALVTYLALLFGIAFIVVSISLVAQIRKGKDPNGLTAAQLQHQVQELTEENQQLKTDYLQLQEQADALQTALNSAQSNSEYLESSTHEANANADQKAQQLKAYSLLVTAQHAYINQDADTLRSTAKELSSLYTLLDRDGQDAYFLLLEYMEQPYFGTGTVTP